MRWSLWLILGLLSSGCAGDFNRIHTAGSFRTVPGEGTSMFVWAEDPTVRKAVQTWLRSHGLIVLDTTLPRNEGEPCPGCERKAALSEARLLKAEQVVIAYTSRNENPEQLSVSVQSLSAQNEEDLWSGTARKNLPADISGELLQTNLTLLSCHALATVWRYRPAGYLSDASKDYCYYHF
ncbi:MAG TPA: hypothetical protein VJ805_04395 [Nitrospiraceae bacterium]|nr:hypothetical protein [Nitrospiraceae bacterium]